MKQDIYDIVKNFFIFFLGNFGSKIVTFLMLPFYTNFLTTEQYGTIDIVNSLALLFSPLITLGMADAIFRFIMSKDYDNKEVFSIGITINITGWIILLIFSIFTSNFISFNYLSYFFAILLSNTLYSLLSNFAKAKNKLMIYSLLGLLQTILFVSLNIVFIKTLSYGILGYFASNVISNLVCILVYIIILKIWRYIDLKKITKKTLVDMLKYSLPLIPTTLSWWIIMLSDRYMITYFLGLSENGIYAIANKIPTILNTIVTIFIQAWQISSINIYEKNTTKLSVFYSSSINYYEMINFVVGSIFICISPLIMYVLVKGRYYEGWIAVPFLIISIIFSSLSGYVATIFSTYKKNVVVCTSVILGAIINIIFNYFLIPKVGILGAAISSSLGYMFVFLIRLVYSRKLVDYKISYKKLSINIFLIFIQSFAIITSFKMKYVLQLIVLICFVLNNLESIRNIYIYLIYLGKKRES